MKILLLAFVLLAGCRTPLGCGIGIHTNGDAGPPHDADLRLLP